MANITIEVILERTVSNDTPRPGKAKEWEEGIRARQAMIEGEEGTHHDRSCPN